MIRWSGLVGIAVVLALIPRARARAEDQKIGANTPWVTYDAASFRTNGTFLAPDYTGHTAVREASGRRCVRLNATDQYLQFTALSDAQGIVVRYSIPNAPDGSGLDATLSLYIDGKLKSKLPMTSRYTYLYGNYPFTNQPSAGNPRHFWDELRLLPGAIHQGDVLRLQKDSDDTASEYLIDFVELETVPAPLQQPTNSISITDFGAVADARTDAQPAFQAAIAAAKQQHLAVWIPPGEFAVKGAIKVSDVTIRGAGMWYSTLVGVDDYTPNNRISIEGNGSNITLSDFAIIGKLRYRGDSEPNDGIGGSFGTGSVIRNLWIEHTKTGAWLVNSDGLLVEGCRFRDTIADGINLCVGMRNTVVRNCTARGTGDDCFAIWPATYATPAYAPGHNQFINCTAQLPFLAQGFSIYGGDSNSIQNCLAIDIPYGAGILASTMFRTDVGFIGTTTYENVRILRSGDRDGAIAVMTNLRDLNGLRFDNVEAIDCPTDGIKFNCIKGRPIGDTAFTDVKIINPGIAGTGYGVFANSGAAGSAIFTNITITGAKTIVYKDDATAFNFIQNTQRSAVETGMGDSVARGAMVDP